MESEISKDLVGYRTFKLNNNPTQYTISHQFEFSENWVITTLNFSSNNDKNIKLKHFNVTPLNQSLQETNKFTFKGKSWIHYLTFLSCIITPIFVIFTLIIALKTRFEKRKWLWILFILVGIASFNLNWTSGQFNLNLLRIQLLGSGYYSSGLYAPLILSFSLPIGALMFWLKKSKTNKQVDSKITAS